MLQAWSCEHPSLQQIADMSCQALHPNPHHATRFCRKIRHPKTAHPSKAVERLNVTNEIRPAHVQNRKSSQANLRFVGERGLLILCVITGGVWCSIPALNAHAAPKRARVIGQALGALPLGRKSLAGAAEWVGGPEPVSTLPAGRGVSTRSKASVCVGRPRGAGTPTC